MKAQLIDGKRISAEIKAEAAEEAAALKAKGITPCLAVVLVGDDSASQVYVNNKKKACEAVGIRSVSHVLSGGTTEEALLELIAKLNADKDIHGILVQMPVPKQIDERKVILAIDPKKCILLLLFIQVCFYTCDGKSCFCVKSQFFHLIYKFL